MPPHTPNSMRLSSASARHSYRTGQPRQIRLAMFCSAPWTNSASGSPSRHAARLGQSVIMPMCLRPPFVFPPTLRVASGRLLEREGGRVVARPSCSVVIRLRNVPGQVSAKRILDAFPTQPWPTPADDRATPPAVPSGASAAARAAHHTPGAEPRSPGAAPVRAPAHPHTAYARLYAAVRPPPPHTAARPPLVRRRPAIRSAEVDRRPVPYAPTVWATTRRTRAGTPAGPYRGRLRSGVRGRGCGAHVPWWP